MLSVLIPTYNYDICPLVNTLLRQFAGLDIPFEIICMDDASGEDIPDCTEICKRNAQVHFIKLPNNIGRSRIRNRLAMRAQYDWLLYMDADTLPVRENYISTYVDIIRKNPPEHVFFGGITYRRSDFSENTSLRYEYGVKRERIPVKKRRRKPYTSLLMSNTLMKKTVFDRMAFNEKISLYGHEDAVFSFDLYGLGYGVLHIDNPSYHTGLEENEVFLQKTKIAVKNLWYLHKQSLIYPEINRLLKYYLKLKRWGLVPPASYVFTKFHRYMEKRLKAEKPSLQLFDLYRLTYLCYVSNRKPG